MDLTLRRPARRLSALRLGTLGWVLCGLALLPVVAIAQPGYGGAQGGVTLFEDAGFQGRAETFYQNDPYLKDDRLGQDRASSVRVAPGCAVTLYRDVDYRGRSVTLYEDVADLGRTEVGNDSVSSLEVHCGRGGRGPGYGGRPGYGGGPGYGNNPGYGQRSGVTFYTAPDFRGRSETFTIDDPVLNNNAIGNDGAVSVTVAPGCQVTVFEHFDYRGRSFTFQQDVRDLRYTQFGNRGVSSVRVQCHASGGPGGGYPPSYEHPGTRGITLYRDANYGGRYQHFSSHVADLGDSVIGNDAASSVKISQGCRAVLYSDAHFRGRSTVVDYDMAQLVGTQVGNDRVSSVQIECRGRY